MSNNADNDKNSNSKTDKKNYIAIMAIAIFNNNTSIVLVSTDTIIENKTSHNSNIIKN